MRTSGGRGSTRAQRENVALATARRASHVVAKSSSITDQIEKPALRAGFFASVADEDVCQSGGVPFTGRLAEHAAPLPGDRVKGKITVFPLTIPAVPHGNRCCALRSPPGLQPAVGSTRPARPFRARSCLDSPLAAIPGGQPLSCGLRFADFSGEPGPRCTPFLHRTFSIAEDGGGDEMTV